MALYPYWLGQVPKDWNWCNNVGVTETETSIPKEKISLTDTGSGENHLEQLKDEIDNPTSNFPEGGVVDEATSDYTFMCRSSHLAVDKKLAKHIV